MERFDAPAAAGAGAVDDVDAAAVLLGTSGCFDFFDVAATADDDGDWAFCDPVAVVVAAAFDFDALVAAVEEDDDEDGPTFTDCDLFKFELAGTFFCSSAPAEALFDLSDLDFLNNEILFSRALSSSPSSDSVTADTESLFTEVFPASPALESATDSFVSFGFPPFTEPTCLTLDLSCEDAWGSKSEVACSSVTDGDEADVVPETGFLAFTFFTK